MHNDKDFQKQENDISKKERQVHQSIAQISIPEKLPDVKIPRISKCMPRPYLEIEILAVASGTTAEWTHEHKSYELSCRNIGTGSSTSILEAFHIAGEGEPRKIVFPVILIELERIHMEVLHLPAGAEVTRPLSFDIPKESVGVMFVLSDPLLDPCRRIFENPEDLKEEERHISYVGK